MFVYHAEVFGVPRWIFCWRGWVNMNISDAEKEAKEGQTSESGERKEQENWLVKSIWR